MSSSKKNGPVKGLCACVYQSHRLANMEIQSVMLVFLTQLSELLPFNLLSGFNSPPPPSLCKCVKVQYIGTDAVWLGGGEVLSPVGDHILQEFNT